MEIIHPDIILRSLRDFDCGEGNWEFSILKERQAPGMMSVLLATNAPTERRVVVKAHKRKRRNLDQFKALEAMLEAGVSCVKPLHLDSKHRFFLMEWIDAPLLASCLGKDGHDDLIRQSGQWVSQLQRATATRKPPLRMLHTLRVPSVRGDTQMKAIAADLRKRLLISDLHRSGVVRLHADFHATNIFCLPEGLMAFDAQYNRFGSPFHDPATFLMSLAILRERAAKKNAWCGSAEHDRKSFFSGYGPLAREEVGLFDLVEDFVWVNSWARARAKNLSRGYCRILEKELEMRGLLGAAPPSHRPGRLVAEVDGAGPSWSNCFVPRSKSRWWSIYFEWAKAKLRN